MIQPDSTTNTGAVGALDILKVARDHEQAALNGQWPGVQVPHYALSGLFKMMGDEIERLRATPTPASEADVIERCAKVAESEIGIASGYRSGGSFGAARVDQGRIIAAAIRSLSPTKEPRDD